MKTCILACVIFWSACIAFCRAGDAPVTVAWDRAPDHDAAIIYRVWRGIELLGETKATRLEVRLPTNQTSTITATAHRGDQASDHSKPLVVAPAVVHSSPNMRVWIVEKSSYFFHVLEREGVRTERQFFRINYHTPSP